MGFTIGEFPKFSRGIIWATTLLEGTYRPTHPCLVTCPDLREAGVAADAVRPGVMLRFLRQTLRNQVHVIRCLLLAITVSTLVSFPLEIKGSFRGEEKERGVYRRALERHQSGGPGT